MCDLIALSLLALDLPTPPNGWAVELAGRGITTVTDDVGRECVARSDARLLLAAHRQNEDRKRRHRAEVERAAVEADARFRASLPPGVPVGAVPEGLSVARLWCASDPLGGEGSGRRVGLLEHSLAHRDGAIVYHPIGGES